MALQKVPSFLLSLTFRIDRSRRTAAAKGLPPPKCCCVWRVHKSFRIVPWACFILLVTVSFVTLLMLTSTGFLESGKADKEGVPCGCQGISGGQNVERDWLLLIIMIFVVRTFVWRPVMITAGTCAFLWSKRGKRRRGGGNTTAAAGGGQADARVGVEMRGGRTEVICAPV